jgi:cytochrome c oxidase subunit III
MGPAAAVVPIAPIPDCPLPTARLQSPGPVLPAPRPPMTHPASRTLPPSDFALRLILATAAVYAVAGGLAYTLVALGRRFAAPSSPGTIPPALWASTLLLGVGSWWLQRAIGYVRLERQRPFRRCLLIALGAGTLFVAVQSFGLWCLLERRPPIEPDEQGDSTVPAFVFIGLHALHFLLALFALVYVTIRAVTDRYDHEYFWGVTACATFWHFLGIVWLVILGVFAVIV